MSLRDTAALAAISAGHLSEIEKGRSHASLPVLLRLSRILRFPLSELLPRIGGHRVRESRIDPNTEGVHALSNAALDLQVWGVRLRRGTSRTHELELNHEAFVFIVSGSCALTVADDVIELGARDAVEVAQVREVTLRAVTDVLALLAVGSKD